MSAVAVVTRWLYVIYAMTSFLHVVVAMIMCSIVGSKVSVSTAVIMADGVCSLQTADALLCMEPLAGSSSPSSIR